MIKVEILFDPKTKQLAFSLPNDNMLALSMLEYAKAFIYARLPMVEGEKQENKIIPFSGPLPPIKQ